MPDFFGAIAAASQDGGRLPLIYPVPSKKSGKALTLEKCNAPISAVPKKMSTKEELDALIARLDAKYAPFRRRVAPPVANDRRRIYIKEFGKVCLRNKQRSFCHL